MNTRITTTLGISLATLLGLSPQAGAESIFPPSHLAANAQFATFTQQQEHQSHIPWYEQAGQVSRQTLIANEVQEESPYPSAYYIKAIRSIAVKPESTPPHAKLVDITAADDASS